MKHHDKATDELIREIKQGLNVDENYRQLFEPRYAQIRRYFQRKGFSPEDSLELTQETFISVFKGLKGFRQEAPFDSWLFSIARNICKSEVGRLITLKQNLLIVPIEPEDQDDSGRRAPSVAPPVDPAPGPLIRMLKKEEQQMLYEEIRQLPEQMRRCVELRVIHGLSYKAIADLMGISIGAVKAHLNAAKKKLSERLRPYVG